MVFSFTKMQGLGNDFVVFDAIKQQIDLQQAQYRQIADRRFGIGCDQILLIERPRLADTEFHYRIFNADGSEVEQCGNGARCFARFVTDKGLTDHRQIPVGTAAGRIVLQLEDDGQVKVDMGLPLLDPPSIPMNAPHRATTYELKLPNETLSISAVSMGNPHAVLQVDSVEQTEVARLGPLIENHPDFPNRVNVGFMERLDTQHIKLRVYERGTGETLACGTGACAAVVAGRLLGILDRQVQVRLPGGELVVEWGGEGNPVVMSGPAETVFEGTIEL
ncbi:MAG: diaminopimelate epimerase [Gammaproteobacteria bacterium]|nr:diaminopimelate epimerase [Gammaproteobacteria bacterium]